MRMSSENANFTICLLKVRGPEAGIYSTTKRNPATSQWRIQDCQVTYRWNMIGEQYQAKPITVIYNLQNEANAYNSELRTTTVS